MAQCCAGSGCAPACRRSSAASGSRHRTPCSARSSPSSAAARAGGSATYLLGSLGRAEPARLWGIGLVATAIAGLGYGLVALVASRVTGASRAVTIAAGATPRGRCRRRRASGRRFVLGLAAFVVPFALWWLVLSAERPVADHRQDAAGVFDYLFLSPAAGKAQARLLAALAETLPLTLVGMAAGLGFAFLLAILGSVRAGPRCAASCRSRWSRRRMPLVALTPLLVLIFGRGVAVTIAITVSVTFFPAYVTLAQGLALVPRAAFDLVRAYGASGWRELRLVAIPASKPWLFAAAAPRRAARAPRRDDRRVAGDRPRPRQPPQPVARLSRLRHDLDRRARLGARVGGALPDHACR